MGRVTATGLIPAGWTGPERCSVQDRSLGRCRRSLKWARRTPLEREANQAAKQVMRMPDEVAFTPPAVKRGGSPGLQRKCSCGGTCPQWRGEKSDEEHGSIRRKPAGPRLSRLGSSPAHSGMTAPPSVHEVLNSPGRPLDSATRAFMEPRFGYDFSSVRLHTGAAARSSAVNVGALAYTVGRHVALREESAPRELLAHELAHVVQQDSAPAPLVQRDDGKQGSSAPQTPGLEARLNVIVEEGPAIQSRLDQIMRTGGPVPQQTKVIGAAIIDVEGYTGPKEMRAISGADTDALGAGAAVYHASSPNPRTLSATRSIAGSGPRRDFPFAHINDAEMKLFEDIIARLPKDARGTIHFATIRVRQVNGQTVFEAYPACSGCIRASFEAAGSLPKIDLVSHAPVHPTGTANMGNAQAPHSEHDEPITNPQGLKPGSVHMSPRDADVDPATGRVVPGPNTDAAGARRAQNPPSKLPVEPDAEGHAASPPGRYTGAAIGIGTTIATLGLSLKTTEPKAAEWVSNAIGKVEIERMKETHFDGSRFGRDFSLDRQIEPLVMDSEISGLENRHAFLMLGNNVAHFHFDYMDMPQNTPGFVPRKGGEDDLPFDPKTLAQKNSSRQAPEIDLEAEPPSAATIARLKQEENDLEAVADEPDTQLDETNQEKLSRSEEHTSELQSPMY